MRITIGLLNLGIRYTSDIVLMHAVKKEYAWYGKDKLAFLSPILK